MAQPLWFYRLLKVAFPYRGLLARLARLPLFGQAIDHLLFRGDDIYIVPRDAAVPMGPAAARSGSRVIQVGRPIDVPDDTVLPSQVVEQFVHRATHRFIMNECICRAAEGCQDYPIDLGCLFLGEAATGIHPHLGRPVSLEEALAHLARCRDAGLVHLIGRNKIDTLWLGVTPGERLLTICHCCPCCCLWRILPQLPRAIGRKVSRMPGVEVRVSDRCTGCGTCHSVCFVSAIGLQGSRSVIAEACVGCGRCVSVCPDEAIELRISGQPASVCADQLSRLVDVT